MKLLSELAEGGRTGIRPVPRPLRLGRLVDDIMTTNNFALKDLITARVVETGLAAAAVPFVADALVKHAEFLGARPDPEASLFAYRRKLTEVAENFSHVGLTYERYRDAAARKPALFYLAPATVIDNISGVVAGLQQWGLTEAAYVTALVTQQPQLAYLSPARVMNNVTDTVAGARHYGLTEPSYIGAAVKRAQLFYQASQTITGHMHAIFRLQKRQIINGKSDLLNFLLNSPDKLTLGQSNLQLRMVYALAKGITNASPSRILGQPRAKIEAKMVAHYGLDPEQKQISELGAMAYAGPAQRRGHRAVLAFIQRGLLTGYKSVPRVL